LLLFYFTPVFIQLAFAQKLPIAFACQCRRKLMILWFLALTHAAAYTARAEELPPNRFDFNTETVTAYKLALRLQLADAQKWSDKAKAANPDNLAPILVDNYIDFLVLFFDENPAVYKARRNHYSQRIKLLQSGPENAALTRFSQAIVHLQWAAIKLRFGDRLSAGFAMRDAFKLAMQNEAQFPGFTPNLMITGAMQMAAGTIPQNLRWLSSLMGISGNLNKGKAQVDAFLRADDPWAKLFHDEGIFYHIYLQYYLLNEPDKALAFIENQQLDLVNNHVFAYMATNLYLNNKQSKKAQRVIANRNKSAVYYPSPVWDFQMAYAKLYEISPEAEPYFKRYLSSYKGSTYLKDTWLKFAWFYRAMGNEDRFRYCLQQVKTRGNTYSEADKTALREAEKTDAYDVVLLKARLLNDGGYNNEALKILKTKPAQDYTSIEDKLEYVYRYARVLDDLGQYQAAIKTYSEAYTLGKNRPEYYAARASLQIGLIYEKWGNKPLARRYFQQCIDLHHHDYEDSLEQKAKAGITRCFS